MSLSTIVSIWLFRFSTSYPRCRCDSCNSRNHPGKRCGRIRSSKEIDYRNIQQTALTEQPPEAGSGAYGPSVLHVRCPTFGLSCYKHRAGYRGGTTTWTPRTTFDAMVTSRMYVWFNKVKTRYLCTCRARNRRVCARVCIVALARYGPSGCSDSYATWE